MTTPYKTTQIGTLAGVGLLLMTGAALAGPSCEKGPIQIGAVATVTGPVDFSASPKTTAAYFDALNAAGGIDGCEVAFEIADDRGDPLVATQAARNLIDNKKVVAMAGNASLLDCGVNAQLYQRSNVMDIAGLGVDPVCFTSPSVASVSPGPYVLSTAMLYFASEELGAEKVCAFNYVIGGWKEAMETALKEWELITGNSLHILDMTLPVQGDLTPYLIRARDEGCDAVFTNQVEPGIVQWINTADAQGISGIDWVFLASGYTEGVAAALKDSPQPIYVGTEWEPYTLKNDANQEWYDLIEPAGITPSAFSQGGFLAGKIITDVIKGIDGEVTREAVTKALREMEPASYPIAAGAYRFGEGSTDSPMRSTKVVKLNDGVWEVVTPEWIELPTVD
ncbi:ABC transporter substrate-binding protein [Celeribacter sp. SCSIO 80788]|jgi:branched-chain amino acid transport system substrate-binding protein|uniref:ABC transporter substrate-binding protein n=1 Tax=Celeribacter sp. SCSIO 80788 TaxID=3117013 RepID=UPI003DA4F894